MEQRDGTQFANRLNQMFAAAGLPFKSGQDKVPNSRRALMLGELARDRGVHRELHPRLFDAYWARGRDLGDEQVLLDEGQAVGLGAEEIRGAVTEPGYLERVQEQTAAAVELGVTGVPGWLVNERLLVPGAQPHELFDSVMERLGHKPLTAGSGGPPAAADHR